MERGDNPASLERIVRTGLEVRSVEESTGEPWCVAVGQGREVRGQFRGQVIAAVGALSIRPFQCSTGEWTRAALLLASTTRVRL